MSSEIDRTPYEQIVAKIDPQATLKEVKPLEGGVSTQATLLELQFADGSNQKMVMRQHSNWQLEHNPDAPEDEARLLNILLAAGKPVPRPFLADLSCEIIARPYIVVEYVEGATDFTSDNLASKLSQLAAFQADLHGTDWSPYDLSFVLKQTDFFSDEIANRPDKLDESTLEPQVRAALEQAWPWPQHNRSSLLHFDFWPGNVLWRDGKLAAVIDWEDVQLGDPLLDFAQTRLELLWAFGQEAMEQFTRDYQKAISLDYTNLPYWELCCGLRPAFQISKWSTDAAEAAMMRERLDWYLAQAFGKLGLDF